MSKISQTILAGTLSLCLLSCNTEKKEADYQVVPLPQELNLTQEAPFTLTSRTSILYPEGNDLLKRNAEFLSEYINQSTGYALPV